MDEVFRLFESRWLINRRYPKNFNQGVEGDARVWKMLDAGCMIPLSGRDEEGRKVFLIRSKMIDADLYDNNDINRMFHYILLVALEEEETQIAGVIFIFDFSGMSSRHILNPIEIRDFIELHNITLVRQKEIYLVNLQSFANVMVELIKMAMSEKLKKRFFVIKNNDKLTNYLDPKLLPKEYGGHKSAAEMIDEFKQFVDSKRGLFNEILESYNKIHWEKVPVEKLHNKNCESVGSFRKLEID